MIGPIASSFQSFPFHLTPSLVSQPWPGTSLMPTSMPFLIPHIFTLLHLHAPSFSIISVSSYTAVLSRPDSGRDKIKEHAPYSSEKGTWFGLLFKLVLLASVVAGGYYGYQEYLRQQRYGGGNFGGFTEMFSSNSRYWIWSVPRTTKLTRVPVLCIYLALLPN